MLSSMLSSNLMSSNMMSSTMFMVGGASALGSIGLIFYLLMHEIIFTKKINPNIEVAHNYIKTEIKKGSQYNQIKESLSELGHDEKIIENARVSVLLEKLIKNLREKEYSYRKIKQLAKQYNWPKESFDFIIKKQREEMKPVFAPAIVALTLVFLSVVLIKTIEVLS